MSNAFICIIGISTVFIGLICIIIICKLMSLICGLFPEKQVSAPAAAPAQSAKSGALIENKQEIIAAVCAAIAEDLGTDVKNIKVVSFKKA